MAAAAVASSLGLRRRAVNPAAASTEDREEGRGRGDGDRQRRQLETRRRAKEEAREGHAGIRGDAESRGLCVWSQEEKGWIV